jgi:ParB-like chromosome segregation protein Spo0J
MPSAFNGAGMKISSPLIDDITVPERHRDLDQAKVAVLVESMRELGQLHPISVFGTEDSITLVAGRHRLEAARQLGWAGIDAVYIEADELKRELIEIDENLCRAELRPADQAVAISRRKAIYEKLNPETAHGGDRKSAEAKSTRQNGDLNDRFSKDTADRTGLSERTIQRNAERARKIGEDNLRKIAGTSLDKPGELDALAKLDAATRDDICNRAASGEQVSAKAALNPQPLPQPEPADSDRWREQDIDQAAAEEAQAEKELEFDPEEDESNTEDEFDTEDESDTQDDPDDDDELDETDQDVDQQKLMALLKDLLVLVYDERFDNKLTSKWQHHPGLRHIEQCTPELYDLIKKAESELGALRWKAERSDLVRADLAAKKKAKEYREKAEAEAAHKLAKSVEPELRQRAEKLGCDLKRRKENFYLTTPRMRKGGFRCYAMTLREVVAQLDREEEAAEATDIEVAA